jgi:transcriptional regulator with XRE-family HTH domain
MKIDKLLKREIENCGKTRYQISQETGLEQSALSRFINGERSLSLESANILLEYFGYEIKKVRK